MSEPTAAPVVPPRRMPPGVTVTPSKWSVGAQRYRFGTFVFGIALAVNPLDRAKYSPGVLVYKWTAFAVAIDFVFFQIVISNHREVAAV